MAEISLSSLLHLGEDHGGDLLRGEHLLLILVVHLQLGLSSHVDDGERPVLHIALDRAIVEVAADEPLSVEHGVGGVDGRLILGRVPDEALGVGEGHVAGGRPVALVVGDDFNLEIGVQV